MIQTLTRWLAHCWPFPARPRADLRQAVGFLDWEVDATTIKAASLAGTTFMLVAAAVLGVRIEGPIAGTLAVTALLVGVLALATGHLVEGIARVRRASALGGAPPLVTRIAFQMSLTPAPEAAARFGGTASSGPLSESLAAHVRRTADGPAAGLRSFAREWGQWFDPLERACSLVETAGSEPPSDRDETLERARQTVLDGVEARTSEFAASIAGPTTALYAFGVLLPLSLVSLLPALSAAGVATPLVAIVLGYDLVLPLCVAGASGWLLSKRPVAFRPAPISRSHPDVWVDRWQAFAVGCVVTAVVWWGVGLLLPDWCAVLTAVGCGIGGALLVAFQPMQSVRERGRAIDDGLGDALTLVGRRVERGEAVESALTAVGSELPGATGELLRGAARRHRRLGIDVERAFTGPHGALVDVPSSRAESAASLLALAANAGSPAGSALVAMGRHFDTLDAVERESRRELARVSSTLSNTAAVFGPLVGGATVALTEVMGSGGPLGGSLPVDALGLAVGSYVLVLAVVLTALSAGLTCSLDRSLVGYRVGLVLPTGSASFVTAYVGTGLLL